MLDMNKSRAMQRLTVRLPCASRFSRTLCYAPAAVLTMFGLLMGKAIILPVYGPRMVLLATADMCSSNGIIVYVDAADQGDGAVVFFEQMLDNDFKSSESTLVLSACSLAQGVDVDREEKRQGDETRKCKGHD